MASLTTESEPLLRHADTQRSYDDSVKEDNIVDFDPNGDADNPLEWPNAYKWCIVLLLALTAFTVTFTCISLVPVANSIVTDLNDGHPSKSASVLLVTIWELGEAAGPLFIAPLSEVFGRYRVMNAANVSLVAATLLASFSPSVDLLIAARFLTGLAVASNVLNPAIVGDIFISEQRGAAMSLIMVAPLVGGAIGPAIGGAIASAIGWRSIMWISAALAGTCTIVFLICFRETYKVTILNRRAARLRKETGNQDLQTTYEREGAKNSHAVLESAMRPFIVLASSGVLQSMAIFGSVAFTFFYIMSTTLPDILQDIYGLSASATGGAFITFSAGSVVAVVICNQFLDRIYVRLRDAHEGVGQPEYRLPLAILGAFSLPVIVIVYGWVAETHLPLAVMLLAVAIMGNALLLSFLPLMAYVVDAFGLYSASANCAVIVTRCLMGTFLPLATEPLVGKLGYGYAFTVLGGITLVLAPIPVIVMRYGVKWRQGGRYTSKE